MVAISALALSIPLASVGVGFVLPPLLFYFIYVEERRNVSPEDEVNHPHRTLLVRRYQRGLLVTEALSLLGYEGLLIWVIIRQLDIGIVYFGLGQLPILVLFAYGYLKRHPTFDSLAVGATWTFVIMFSLVIVTPQGLTWKLGGVALAWFLIVFAGVESRNIPDTEGDTQTDRTTLAGYLGPELTTALVILLKLMGVITFWALSGVLVAGLALGYLVLLQLFRMLSTWETAHIQGRRHDSSMDREAIQTDPDTQYHDTDRL